MQQAVHRMVDGGLSRLEVLSGPTGRRKWPEDLKGRIVAETLEPGARVAEVARRHGLRSQALTDWRRQAREGKLVLPDRTPASFASIMVVNEAPEETPRSASSRFGVELECQGVVVRLPETASAGRIGEIARALRSPR